jgi:hypothetical protein
VEFNRDFRYDLKVGQMAESWLADILMSKTVEIKRDFKASRTGRVFVEFFSRGKPSGIDTTEADFWAFIIDGETVVILPTARLKELVQEAKDEGKIWKGGDSNTSQGVLIDLERLVK